MEKLGQSKEESKIQEGFNKITVFLGRFVFNTSLDTIKKTGLINCYCKDEQYSDLISKETKQELLYVLFKNKKLSKEQIEKILISVSNSKLKVLHSYELIEDHFMIVLEFPKNFTEDYHNLVEGKYSKLSKEFKKAFPETKPLYNKEGKEIAKEYTLYYHIYNKTKWLKNFWMERLGLAEISENLELWSKPSEEDLVFNIKNYFTKLKKLK